MAEVLGFGGTLVFIYQTFLQFLPPWLQTFVNLFLLVLVVTLYSIFIWKFYRFVAKKNLIDLNLKKFNRMEKPFATKILAGVFYFIEYIIVLPFMIFFWFAIFTTFLLLLTEGLEVQTILIISAVIVGAIRMTSYYKEDLSKDLSKLLPLTLLGLSMTKPGFFNFERILGNFTEVPNFLGEIIIYLLFIIVLELILRVFEIIFSIFEVEPLEIQEDASPSGKELDAEDLEN